MASSPSLALSALLLALLSLSPALSSAARNATNPYGAWTTLATVAGDSGAACGYSNVSTLGYSPYTAAASPKIFTSGAACGSCYEISCIKSKTEYCLKTNVTVTVTVTNLCTGTNTSDGFCNLPHARFALSPGAFNKIALPKGGIIPVRVRRVPCLKKTGGVAFTISGNPYFLLVLISNVGGGGDLAAVDVKANLGAWMPMYRNYGSVWSISSTTSMKNKRLSFRLRTILGNETLVADNVAPRSWAIGKTYYSKTNFALNGTTS